MGRTLFLLPFLLLSAHEVWGESFSSKNKVEWPGTGMTLCQQLQDPHFRQECLQCFETGSTFKQIKDCTRTWLPKVLAKCTTHTFGSATRTFNLCIARKMKQLDNTNSRAELLYRKGIAILRRVLESEILEDGPAAVLSSIAQDLLFNGDSVKKALSTSGNDCSMRFQVDSSNENWHRPPSQRPKEGRANSQKTRTADNEEDEGSLVYEYGVMGHQMPFHGIGPLAVDILKGICNMHYLEKTDNLQVFVDSYLSSNIPLPAWLFQESLKKISSIQLP